MSEETKHDRFKRLSEARINKTLKNIGLLENLANTNNYHYTREDYERIIASLRDAVDDLEAAFKKREKGNFKW